MDLGSTLKIAVCAIFLIGASFSNEIAAQAQVPPTATAVECSDFPTFPTEKSLPGGLARAIYSQISSKFQYGRSWEYCDVYYSDLADQLGLPVETDRNRAMAQLKLANEELLSNLYLSGYRWFEPASLSQADRDSSRWQIRYYPGVRFTHGRLLQLWYEALSPDNSEVTAALNNRSVSFDNSRGYRADREAAQPILEKALNCARRLGIPRDIIACLCNLGCFYYLGGDYSQADQYFREGVELARSTTAPHSPALAPLIDFEAMSARGLTDYERAEKLYTESLQIRTAISGYYKPDVAHSLMNLGCLYADWSYKAEDPKEKRNFGMRSQDLFSRADEIMNPPTNKKLAAEWMQEAVRNHDLAALADPDQAWKYRARSRQLAADSYKLASNLVLVNSKSRADVIPNSQDLSTPPVGRPLHSCMTVNAGTGKLASMVGFAQSILEQCKEKPPEKPPEQPEPGLATILGNWSVPTDISTQANRKDREGRIIGTDVASEKDEKNRPSQFQDVTIYLCHYPKNPQNILNQIRMYGAAKGLGWEGLGELGSTHGWPANHLQAEELQAITDNTARAIVWKTDQTDKLGDYKFENVPKGDYLLYASVCTKKQCLIWIIPKAKIEVRRVDQFRYDFVEKTGIRIWEDGHPSAPETPPEYFSGSQAKAKNDETSPKP